MSLLKLVIKSFRKLFQFKKSPLKRKPKPRRKKSGSRKRVPASKNIPQSASSRSPSQKKTAEPKMVHQSPRKLKSALKSLPVKNKLKENPPEIPKGKCIGEITHYFTRIKVIVLEVKNGPIKVGDRILIQGSKSNFTQPVKSMQIESVEVKSAKKGQIIGLQVTQDAQVGDQVFLIK